MKGFVDEIMGKIIEISEIPTVIEKLKSEKKTIALAGGCFDVVHLGHVTFLEEAKKQADILIILLESDQKIKLSKGAGRPVHDQKSRAKILASIEFVDYVIVLPLFTKSEEYDHLVNQISPDIIAVTEGDKDLSFKERSAKVVGARLCQVPFVKDFSSSKLIQGSDL